MPCRDSCASPSMNWDPYPKQDLESMLCALMRFLKMIGESDKDVIAGIDWKEAGVPKEKFVAWWAEHRAKDEARQIKESEDRARAKVLEDARKKARKLLSPEERRLLGIK